MAAALVGGVGHLRLGGSKLLQGGIAEIAHAKLFHEDGLAFFGLTAPLAVLAGCDRVLHHGVADDNLRVCESALVHGEMFVGERTGVQEESVAGHGCGDDELIHDAAGGFNIFVFGALTEHGDLLDGQVHASVCQHGHCAGDFHGGGGAYACGEGYVAGDVKVEGGGLDSAFLQLPENAYGIVAPLAARWRSVAVAEGQGLLQQLAGEGVEPILAWCDGGACDEGNRHGQNESAGVVRVLAEKIDAGGCDAFNHVSRGRLGG